VNLSSEMMSFAGFLRGLPDFLREPVSLDEALSTMRLRLADRESAFLATIERGVFGNARSPYRKLFARAGCELADLRAMVRVHGLTPTLRRLREAGIYIGFEEFKGRQPIVRGEDVIEARPSDFDNPRARRYFPVSTGGSTGRPRRVLMDLEFLRTRVVSQLVMMEAHGLRGIPFAQWAEVPPGHGLEALLVQSVAGDVADRWFAPVYDGRMASGARYRMATRATIAVARRCGKALPYPEPLHFDQAEVLARWAEEALQQRGRCAIRAHVSKALRVALAAEDRGIDLTGLTFSSGGEPATPAKAAAIRRSGARFIPNYFFMEAGPVGLGCPESPDPGDQHFMADHLALITAPRRVPPDGACVDAFHVTTLLPTAPKLLLNLEIDDYGTIETRDCGCLLGQLGLTTHLRGIRSFAKLTGEGVTLVGSDMERILEEELPARFGGTALDYQLVELEDERGLTRLALSVHPRLANVDEAALLDAVLSALSRTGDDGDMSRGMWRAAGTLQVRREPPQLSGRGKHWLLRREA